MTKVPNRKVALGLFVATMLVTPGLSYAADGKISGMITSHEGSTVVVRTGEGDTPITLNEGTKIRATSGLWGLTTDDETPEALIRGLAVEVKTAEDGTVTAVTFKKSDLKTAQAISAGLHGTETRVAGNEANIRANASGIVANAGAISSNAAGINANATRLDNVGQLEAAGRTKVYFATGSAALNDKGREDLKALAAQAKAINGYRLLIVGRADTTGAEGSNQKLSEARAAAVQSYLVKSSGIIPANILPTTGLGESAVAEDPDPPKTADEARRVTVTIAVSKASLRQ